MTVRDELEKIFALGHAAPTLKGIDELKTISVMFLRDHGPALLAMVEDAERYKHCRDATGMEGFWIAHGKFGEGCSRWNGEAADKAIDKAREGK